MCSAWSRAAAAVAMAVARMLLTPVSPMAASADPRSAIGDEAPLWMAVSPDYEQSHMVAALAADMAGCTQRCMHLWVTRDAGESWHDSRLPFDAAHVAVLTGGSAGEAVVVETQSALERTDDDGATWRAVGPAGIPVAVGRYVGVAVPGGPDFEVTSWGTRPVAGSAGAAADLAFGATTGASGDLLAVADTTTGADLVERCDAALRCSGSTPLPGAKSPDVGLVLDSAFGNDGIAFARTTTGLYRTGDGGRTFVPVPPPALRSATYSTVAAVTTAPSPGGHDTVYVAVLGVLQPGSTGRVDGGVYRSDDGGTSWHALGTGTALGGGATAVVVAPDGRVFAGYVNSMGAAGLLCNRDGRNWASTCSAHAAQCTACPTGSGSQSDAPKSVDPGDTAALDSPQAAGSQAASPAMALAAGADDGGLRAPILLISLVMALAVAAVPLSTLRRRRP